MTRELLIGLEATDLAPGNVEAITFGPPFDDDASLVLVADDTVNFRTQDTVFPLLRVDTQK